jgi:hypothetical protein
MKRAKRALERSEGLPATQRYVPNAALLHDCGGAEASSGSLGAVCGGRDGCVSPWATMHAGRGCVGAPCRQGKRQGPEQGPRQKRSWKGPLRA